MKHEQYTVYIIWTNKADEYAGISCVASEKKSLKEANTLALKLNKDAVDNNAHYRYFVLE